VWTAPTVAKTLQEDYVLISLFVDDKTPLPQTMTVQENGQTRTLRTVGDKWSYLQRSKFGANAQPFYVPVNNEGRPLVGSYAYKEDENEKIYLHNNELHLSKKMFEFLVNQGLELVECPLEE